MVEVTERSFKFAYDAGGYFRWIYSRTTTIITRNPRSKWAVAVKKDGKYFMTRKRFLSLRRRFKICKI
jgi:hypothetical protein